MTHLSSEIRQSYFHIDIFLLVHARLRAFLPDTIDYIVVLLVVQEA